MTGEHRDTTWRQGAVFTLLDAHGVAVIGVIASHDCDVCADSNVEPWIEYVPVQPVETVDGNLTFGKNPRTLHVPVVDGTNHERIVELDARQRTTIDKVEFFGNAKEFTHQLPHREVIVFRRWLSARYGRSAFANAFEAKMKRVDKRVNRLADKKGVGIRALYFDVDDNLLMERSAEDGPYALAVYVVYPPDTHDDDAAAFAAELEGIFKEEFFDAATGIWTGIELLSCDPIAEDVFPLSLELSTKPWRVDHRSYKGLPATGVYPERDE